MEQNKKELTELEIVNGEEALNDEEISNASGGASQEASKKGDCPVCGASKSSFTEHKGGLCDKQYYICNECNTKLRYLAVSDQYTQYEG